MTGFGQKAAAMVATPSTSFSTKNVLRAGVAAGAALDLLALGGRQALDVEDGLRVDADDVVDDELDAGQADAGVGQLGELEGEFRVADVHHDLDRHVGHRRDVAGIDLEIESTAIDVAGVAFGAGNGDGFAFGQGVRRVAAADDGRDAQFAGDDRRVAGAAAAVGDDRRGALHDRLPVRVGHVGDQHVAGLDLVHFLRVADDADRADADLLADGTAGGQHLGELLEPELLDLAGAGLRLHRFRARLQDVELAVDAVPAPLDVHRPAVVGLDDHRVAGQFHDLGVVEREAVAQRLLDVLGDRRAAGGLFGGEGHLDHLGAEVAADDGVLAGGQHRLVHVELVRVDGALHDGFAEAVAGGDEDGIAETGFGVEREHHAGGALVGAHHALDAGGQGDVGMDEALVHAVGDGAVVVQRGEDFLDRVQDVFEADDVEEGFLLAGEGRIGQVLGGGGRAHGERHVGGGFGDQALVLLGDGDGQVRRERRFHDPAADLRAAGGQRIDVIDVEGVERGVDPVVEAALREEVAVGQRRGGETARHAHAGAGQLADHLAERRSSCRRPGRRRSCAVLQRE